MIADYIAEQAKNLRGIMARASRELRAQGKACSAVVGKPLLRSVCKPGQSTSHLAHKFVVTSQS